MIAILNHIVKSSCSNIYKKKGPVGLNTKCWADPNITKFSKSGRKSSAGLDVKYSAGLDVIKSSRSGYKLVR